MILQLDCERAEQVKCEGRFGVDWSRRFDEARDWLYTHWHSSVMTVCGANALIAALEKARAGDPTYKDELKAISCKEWALLWDQLRSVYLEARREGAK